MCWTKKLGNSLGQFMAQSLSSYYSQRYILVLGPKVGQQDHGEIISCCILHGFDNATSGCLTFTFIKKQHRDVPVYGQYLIILSREGPFILITSLNKINEVSIDLRSENKDVQSMNHYYLRGRTGATYIKFIPSEIMDPDFSSSIWTRAPRWLWRPSGAVGNAAAVKLQLYEQMVYASISAYCDLFWERLKTWVNITHRLDLWAKCIVGVGMRTEILAEHYLKKPPKRFSASLLTQSPTVFTSESEVQC